MANEWVELLKTAPNLIKDIYGDLAKPGVTQVGKALESVLGFGNTALYPIIRCLPLTVYDDLETLYRQQNERFKVAAASKGFTELKYEHGRVDITPLGTLFTKACLKNK